MDKLAGFTVIAVVVIFGVHLVLRFLGWVAYLMGRPRAGGIIFVDYGESSPLLLAKVHKVSRDGEMLVQDSPGLGSFLVLNERDRGVTWHRKCPRRRVMRYDGKGSTPEGEAFVRSELAKLRIAVRRMGGDGQ